MAKRWQIVNGYLHKIEILYMGESEKECLVPIATDCKKKLQSETAKGQNHRPRRHPRMDENRHWRLLRLPGIFQQQHIYVKLCRRNFSTKQQAILEKGAFYGETRSQRGCKLPS